MTYRDRPVRCPRCGIDISRDDVRERWRCGRCNGLLLGVGEVARELVHTAPDLLPTGGVGGLSTIGRRSEAAQIPCAVCGVPMEPVFLGGVELDRCYHDELLWFDHGELSRVLESARKQLADREHERDRSWLSRLFL